MVRSARVVSREVAGETIVVPICNGVGDLESVFTFNAVGTQLWRLLAESRAEKELVAWVSGYFGISAERAAEDVRAFLADLQDTGLIAGA